MHASDDKLYFWGGGIGLDREIVYKPDQYLSELFIHFNLSLNTVRKSKEDVKNTLTQLLLPIQNTKVKDASNAYLNASVPHLLTIFTNTTHYFRIDFLGLLIFLFCQISRPQLSSTGKLLYIFLSFICTHNNYRFPYQVKLNTC